MTDREPEPINAMRTKSPELFEKDIAIPIEVSSGYNSITVYLTYEKLLMLEKMCEEGREQLEDISA